MPELSHLDDARDFDAEHLHVMEHGCPVCGSEDLSTWGETEDRTELDITDHVECNDCKWTISR